MSASMERSENFTSETPCLQLWDAPGKSKGAERPRSRHRHSLANRSIPVFFGSHLAKMVGAQTAESLRRGHLDWHVG